MRAFVNARVLPMAVPGPGPAGYREAFAAHPWTRVEEGILFSDRVLAVGGSRAIEAAASQAGIVPEDLRGATVVPGFVDAHTHFLHLGVKAQRPDLLGATSLEEALRLLGRYLARHPGTGPVIAELWDESAWPERRPPTRSELDGLTPDPRPIVARRVCGHKAVANSAALPLIMARWSDPALVDASTGMLLEDPSLYLNEVLPLGDADLDRALEAACRQSHSLGITAVGDYSQAPYRAALHRAAAAGLLSVRVTSSVYTQQLHDEVLLGMRTGRLRAGKPGSDPLCACGAEGGRAPLAAASAGAGTGKPVFSTGKQGDAASAGQAPPCPRCGGPATVSPYLRDGGLKVFLDGSLGAHTAALREPYHDGPGHGTLNWTDQEVRDWFHAAAGAGIQVHAHAIGDAAIDQGLAAFAAVAATRAQRPRFEHFEVHHDGQIQRVRELGVVASSQPNFVGTWSAAGGMYEARLGERYRLANRFRTLVKEGVPLAFGSDAMPPGPLPGIQAAVHHPEASERLSWEEAVWHYTWAAAWSLFWEHEVGSLAPGLWADLVVLRPGPRSEAAIPEGTGVDGSRSVGPDRAQGLAVERTLVAGKERYRSQSPG